MKTKIRIRCAYITLIGFLVLSNLTFAQNSSKNSGILEKISEGISLINVSNYYITAIDGPDGLLVFDTGNYPGKLDSIITTLFKYPVKYILNTHFHTDHIMDNKMLIDKGALIIAHENTRSVLAAGWDSKDFPKMKALPLPAKYLPKVCVGDALELYLNDNIIQAIHYPAAHTNGDLIYYVRNQNLIVTGDLFVGYGAPYIDLGYGGTSSGFINAVEEILKLCDDNTKLIRVHGGISYRKDLLEYRNKLIDSRKIIARLINEGNSLDEIIKQDTVRYIFKGRTVAYDKYFISAIYYELKN